MQLTAATGSLTSMGVPIAVVYSNSPASHAGLKPGDLLTAIDGRWTTSIADVFAAAAKAEPGRATSVVIQRDGKEQTVTVQPADGA
jgi:S1-C subfamily serine protease